jgi:hypothetical protein
LSLTPAGTCATSPSPHIDSHLPASSSTLESAPQSSADTTPVSPLIPVPNPIATIPAISNTHPMVTRSKNHISKPKKPLMDTPYILCPKHCMFLPLPPAKNLPHLLKPPNLVTGDLQWILNLMPCSAIKPGNWSLHHAILMSLVVAGFSRLKGKLMAPLKDIRPDWLLKVIISS